VEEAATNQLHDLERLISIGRCDAIYCFMNDFIERDVSGRHLKDANGGKRPENFSLNELQVP